MPFLNLNHLRPALLRVVIPVGGTLVAGCETTGPHGSAPVSLSVAAMPQGNTNVGSGASSVKLTKVEFVLAEVAMAQGTTCSTAPASQSGCGALQADPVLINLPLRAALPGKVLEAPVSAGTFTGLQAKLSTGGFGTAHAGWPAGVSVRVVGVYTDPSGVLHDFTFWSAADTHLRISFARPVAVNAARNVTMVVNVERWFTNRQGTVIDPRSSANAPAINGNIRESFQAFQDDDQDGVEDDDDADEVDDDADEVEDDADEVEDDDDDTEVEDDTTAVQLTALSALLSRSRTGVTP